LLISTIFLDGGRTIAVLLILLLAFNVTCFIISIPKVWKRVLPYLLLAASLTIGLLL